MSKDTPEPDYRRNQARDVEQYAIDVVRAWVTDGGVVTDRSSSGQPDFWIDYHDGRAAVGEVGWHADPVIEAMWGNMFRRDEHQVVRLPAGQGRWAVRLDRTARIKHLDDTLPRLAAAANDRDLQQVVRDHLRPGDPLRDAMQVAGIEAMLNSAPDENGDSRAVIFTPITGDGAEQLPMDADVVVNWIDNIVNADPAYADLTAKLLSVPGVDERHVFVMSGSATPNGVDHRLQRLADQLPTRAPTLPAGITHVWITSRWRLPEHGGCAMWTAGVGWSLISDSRRTRAAA